MNRGLEPIRVKRPTQANNARIEARYPLKLVLLQLA